MDQILASVSYQKDVGIRFLPIILALVYLPSHHLAPKGLGSSTGRASHWRCESVGSDSLSSRIPTQVGFPLKSQEKSQDLYTSATVMSHP